MRKSEGSTPSGGAIGSLKRSTIYLPVSSVHADSSCGATLSETPPSSVPSLPSEPLPPELSPPVSSRPASSGSGPLGLQPNAAATKGIDNHKPVSFFVPMQIPSHDGHSRVNLAFERPAERIGHEQMPRSTAKHPCAVELPDRSQADEHREVGSPGAAAKYDRDEDQRQPIDGEAI